MKLSFDSCTPSTEMKKESSPILLLHGMLDSKESWKELAVRLANNTGRKVYWIDARNHGNSPRSDEFDFDLLSQDVMDFMKEQGIAKAILLGSSMGGTTGMKLALEHPALVEKLVVLDMVPKPFPITGWKVVVAVMLMMEEALGAITDDANEEAAKRQVTEYLRKKMPDSSPMKNHEFAARVLPLTRSNNKFVWKTNLIPMEKILISKEDMNKPLTGSFSGPTLFLYGTNSYMKVGEDETIRPLFPEVQFVAVEGATHMVQFEEPGRFVDTVTKFINAL